MFTSLYTNIYFFVKKIFLTNIYVSVNTIWMSLYVFFRKRPSSKYMRNWWGYGGVGVCERVYFHDLTSCFWQHFCLIVYCFICRNVTLPLFRKRCVCHKRSFLSKKINFCCEFFFYIKLFLRTKVSQNAFNFNQIESFLYSQFHYDTLLWKRPVQHSAGNKVYFVLFYFI